MPRADVQRAIESVRNLMHLRHANVMGCGWVNDSLVSRIAALPCLTSANLAHTNISNHSIAGLKVAGHLRTLHLGCTKIKGNSI
jgi:hypothetical protein